ncbi:hypothetical protein VB636_00990, partial [Paracoccus sp. APAP_BH8]|uniref:hypothetical protein n=1 Tax=Paracoccus sp. APAP_BH8 TaxID=3110237 RepID=UPI002FD871EA
ARRIARLLTMGRDHLSRADAVQVARIEAALPALAAVRALTDRFTDIMDHLEVVGRGLPLAAQVGAPAEPHG